MGYDQRTLPETVAVESTFVAFLQHSQTYVHGLSCHSLKNSELKITHSTLISELSRALFPTTSLEIAVYILDFPHD